MTPETALIELFDRVGASKGAPVFVSEEELGHWPSPAVRVMKAKQLLVKARPALSAICPGCEQECAMPVHILPVGPRKPQPFIVCDKRSDVNRVSVPISRLEQWQASANSVVDLIATLLGLHRPDTGATSAERWEIGMFRGTKRRSHVVLSADGRLTLNLAGHSIALADILVLETDGFKLDKRTLNRMIDNPIAGAGDNESAMQRRARLVKRVQEEKNRGNRTFLKTVSEEEDISISRLKQLLQDGSKPRKNQSR